MKKWFAVALLILVLNSAYIFAVHPPTVFYMGNVLFHLALGFALLVASLFQLRRNPSFATFVVSGAAGLFLAIAGNTRDHRAVLWLHVALGLASLGLLFPLIRRQSLALQRAFIFAATLLIVLPAGTWLYRRAYPDPQARIVNPVNAPTSMNEEGGGPKSPFFPSSLRTDVGGTIPSDFFMDSKACGECHQQIYKEWNSSAHHFASFNNQFYRKSIEHMQEVSGSTESSKWCAGCHDHALLIDGKWKKPVREQIDTPEAQNGLGCMSCHSIVHVDSTMGNGGFTMSYPPLHNLASSKNEYIRSVNHFLTYLNPAPHREAFLKPFMRQDSAEFCSTCHKVHLDIPVNNYRWFRGFNDYDNWQASAVSGQGARSFYYPPKPSTCTDCHMPLEPSREAGNHDGQLHSHRFPGANTALAYVNHDQPQMDATLKFLQSGFMSVDIFAVSPVTENASDTKMVRRAAASPQAAPQAMTGFAVGEESDAATAGVLREVGAIAAPIDQAAAKLEPGQTARVDVVVRTRKVGHFFPGGTVDSFDVWLELQGVDATGKSIFWSGSVDGNGKGPVEPGAHFYRSYQLDAEGNPINKRNAWQSRAALYVRLIPPGAADVAHFRVRIPPDAVGPVTFTAKLNYRKFSWYYTQFSYAGKPAPGQDPSGRDLNHDNLKYTFAKADIPGNVSGEIKDHIPDLPIVVVAQARQQIPLGKADYRAIATKVTRERWNDYGIGLLLQGDLKAAEQAFRRVTEADPGYADGWLNVARALIQEGETERAKPFVAKALECGPTMGRVHYFEALVQKADGDYDAALRSLHTVEAQFPRDRVVANQIARLLFLKRDYQGALAALTRVNAVDPEDLQMHYTAMLCYRGLGKAPEAAREEKLFRRFKAEESSQSLTAKVRLLNPEDNNERQLIHDHESSR